MSGPFLLEVSIMKRVIVTLGNGQKILGENLFYSSFRYPSIYGADSDEWMTKLVEQAVNVGSIGATKL